MNASLATGRHAAFTLMECLVVLAILAVLAAIAVPTWQRHVESSRRASARAGMIAAMLALERHALAASTFAAHADGSAVHGEWPRPIPDGSAPHHRLYASPCPGAGLETCVELRAEPVRPDARCGALVLRSSGQWLAVLPANGMAGPMPGGC